VKIYTRTGDDGTTSLLGAGRVLKSSLRVEAYGCVDELNAVLGWARTQDAAEALGNELVTLQARLFQLGAELATTEPRVVERLDRLTDPDVVEIEQWIDRLEADLPPLQNFILPGGSPLGAALHLARTVCRRAERRVVSLAQAEPLEPRLARYLNRVADLLFVMARWANQRAGVASVEWRGRR
jgi:cob(I)alamin adenosyltransferase